MNEIFKDLKVIELANVLAGPAVGMFFAELGAEVIKIENKNTNGDVTRTWKLPLEDPKHTTSAYYASVNWNKQSIFIDLTIEDEKQQVYNLIRNADIVISNYKPGDDVKLGMDYETLKSINPTIIYGHITGFGENNKRTAYDLILQAETGFMSMNGTKESGPIKMPVALIDILAAHHLKESILIALIQKFKTQKGSKVSVSLYDAAIASLANQASNWLMGKYNPETIGSLHPNIAPYGEIFITKDNKKIVLAIGNDKQFKLLCTILEVPYLLKEEAFLTNTNRVKNRSLLLETFQKIISNMEAKELMDNFIKNDIPAGIIKSVAEVLGDAQNDHLILENTDIQGNQNKRVRTFISKTIN